MQRKTAVFFRRFPFLIEQNDGFPRQARRQQNEREADRHCLWFSREKQFPGVSLLSWETGLGNAKYWTLKLLLEHFAPGDKLWKTTTAVAGLAHPRTAAEQTMCDEPGVWCGYKPFCGGSAGQSAAELGPVTLSCDAAGSTIAMVKFADFGTPTGACGTFKSNSSCSSAANTTALVSSLCIGKANCTISPAQLSATTSCGSGAKLVFVVEAACTTQGGKATPAAIPALPPTPPGPPPPPNVFGSVRAESKRLLPLPPFSY